MRRYIALALIGALSIVVLFVCHSATREGDDYGGLIALIDKRVGALGNTNIDGATVSAIMDDGRKYFQGLRLADNERTAFLLSHLNQELIEEEKRELAIRVMLTELSAQPVKAEQCDQFALFLARHHVGSLDSATMALIVHFELNQVDILSRPPWKVALLSFLGQYDNITPLVVERLFDRASKTNQIDVGASTAQATWSDTDKEIIANAALTEQRKMLARRHLKSLP